MNRRILAIICALAPASLLAKDRILLIGGGPTPDSSEAQIEFNVKLVIASLRDLIPDAAITVFYSGGSSPPPNTVVELLPKHAESEVTFRALASVYGKSHENRLRRRAHTVPDVVGSTERDSLLPALRTYLRSLRTGDQAMIVYNGHGTWEPDRSDNALRLWKSSFLSVRDFERLLSDVDPTVPVRFVMTQCYSGAFARAIHERTEPSLALARGTRCGFFAESSERESEGCSASVELGDYRDYTTYFFAGLTGRDRLGRAVPRAEDRDGDGRVTPFDSHLYTLLEGYNGDLPRSTSEDYLERARPWYTRWVGTHTVPDNIYGRLALDMARRYGLPEDGHALGRRLRALYDSLQSEMALLQGERARLDDEASALRAVLQEDVSRRLPDLAARLAGDWPLSSDIPAEPAETLVRGDSRFRRLSEIEERRDELTLREIDVDRLLSQLDRLRRARLLSRSLAQTARHGQSDVNAAYSQLRACESLPLGM